MINRLRSHSGDAGALDPAAILSRLPGFERLSEQAIARLGLLLETRAHPTGAVLVREGEVGGRFFIVAAGYAEVSCGPSDQPVSLGHRGPGGWFGEIALLSPEKRHTATVTAASPVRLWLLSGDAFMAALATDPAALAAWQDAAEMALRQQFLRQSSLFASLSPAAALALAAQLAPRHVAAGTVIVRQGDAGDECYLIRDGEVAIVTSARTENERERARIGPGGMFGEEALLLEASCSASVRATKDCRLLVLSRAELMQAMTADRRVAARVLELFRLRDRPRRASGIVAFPQATVRGEQAVVLKDPARHRYFRLSEDGWHLWQSLDGDLFVRELIIQQFRATAKFSPEAVSDLLQRLAAAGFIETAPFAEINGLIRPPWWQVAAAWLTRAFTWKVQLTGCDRWLSQLYASGVRVLFTRPVLALFAAVAATGFAGLVFALIKGHVTLTTTRAGDSLLLFFYAAVVVSLVLHEAGHAFTTKFYGREVDRIGIGWFWFAPIAYVDTSDMWPTGRWPRIAVDLAGICVNVVCAGVAALAALLIGGGAWAAVLWQFVLVSWWMVLGNLNPLFEFDGYYALSDWLDRPNLRRQAFGRLWQRTAWRTHRLELGYALATLAYVATMGVLIIGTYNALLESWVARLFGAPTASVGGWVIAIAFVLIAALQVASAARVRLV
jgi:putative peptide zinc metalloprotease protein